MNRHLNNKELEITGEGVEMQGVLKGIYTAVTRINDQRRTYKLGDRFEGAFNTSILCT